MQSTCNCIPMFCYFQTHRHTDTSSHEIIIKHVTYHHHHDMHTHNLFSSYFGAEGYVAQWSFISWCPRVHSPEVFHFIVPRGTQSNGLVAWCPKVCNPRVFSSTFCSMYMLVLSRLTSYVFMLSHTYAIFNISFSPHHSHCNMKP
jgi:hypothetical protein